MPLLAVLATAAHVRRRVNKSLLEQRESKRVKRRRRGDVETAVPIEHGRVIPVQLDPFLVHQKHRHACAVFAFVEDLFGFVVCRVEAGNINRAKDRRSFRGDVVLVDCRSNVERREAIEDKLVIASSAESASRAQSR